MPNKPPDLFNFWNELKRRKVVKASLVYLAVAFGILQAVDMIFPRLGLPDWTVTFVLILLVIVFILIIVLTWVYDITPEGIKVTEDLESRLKEETGKKSTKGKRPPDFKTSPELAASQSELEQKVSDLEAQLLEARKLSLSKVLPILIKKLAFPIIIIMVLGLFVIYKKEIVDLLGFGHAKREIAMAHNSNATMYINSGDYESASQEVDLALESDPEYSYAWSNKGVISYMQGNLDKAINEIIKAVSLDPKNSRAPYNLAIALDDKKDFNQAIRWYKKAISIDSTYQADTIYTAASSALGRLYNSFDQPIEAIIILNQAKEVFPGSKYIYLVYKNLGHAYLLQQQTDSALKYLELSYGVNKQEPETNLFLAMAYEASGDLNRSIAQWQNYIDLETDTAKINTAIKHRKELAIRQLQEIIK
jgi:tetratricopeptide (TPR) repeat protein